MSLKVKCNGTVGLPTHASLLILIVTLTYGITQLLYEI